MSGENQIMADDDENDIAKVAKRKPKVHPNNELTLLNKNALMSSRWVQLALRIPELTDNDRRILTAAVSVLKRHAVPQTTGQSS